MKRTLLLAGCALAWGLTALLGAAEAFFACLWMYSGSHAAENMRAAGFLAMMLMPLFLLALWCAVCGTISRQNAAGIRPVERDRGEGYEDDLL